MLTNTDTETHLDAEAIEFRRALRRGQGRTAGLIRAACLLCYLVGLAATGDGSAVVIALLLTLPLMLPFGSLWS